MHTVTFDMAGWRSWWRSPGALQVCLVAAVATVVCIPGCTQRPSSSPQEETLRIGARDTQEVQQVLTEFLFAEPLLSVNWQGRPSPRLATDWKWEDDGRALRIQLLPGVKFHDGSPLTGAVVGAVLRREIANPENLGFEAVRGVVVPDDHTVVVQLSRPDAFLLGVIAGTLIIPDTKPYVGTGPFRIVQRTPTIDASRFAGYYRGTPGIERIQIVTYESQRAAWAAMMRGDVDMVQEVNRESVEFLEGAGRIEMYASIRPYYIPLVFNLRHPILKSVAVRRALAEAVDRDEIVKQAMRGHGRIADDPVWPFHWTYNTAVERHTFNASAARLRLEAAGFPIRPAARQGGMDSRFSFTCLFWSGDPQWERIALLLQRQLAGIGVDLKLEPADQKKFSTRVRKGDFDAHLFQLSSGKSFDWTYRWWRQSPGGYQDSGYSGANEVFDRLRVARTDAEVRPVVGDLRQRFYEDVPALFLAWPESTRAVDARFDVGGREDPDIFANLWRWRRAGDAKAAR